jgi:hypothetical protein
MPNSSRGTATPGFFLGFDGTLALFGTAVLLFAAVTWTARGANVEKTDFSLTYVGARIVHDGIGRQLYDLALQENLRNSFFQHPVPLFYEHPPFEAVLLAPLASVPFRCAYAIWGVANATLWLVLMFFTRRYLPWPRDNVAYICMWLLFAPLWVTLYQGQTSLVLLTAYALTFAFLKDKRDFPAGLALGLGLLKFQFVLPFAFIYLLRRKSHFLLGFSIAAVALALVSVATVGWEGVSHYVGFLLTIGNNPQNVSYGSGVDMPTIHGFAYAILGKHFGGTALNILVAVLSVSLLAWLAIRWQGSDESSSFNLMFAAAIAASLLCGSHMFTHDFSPLILAMLLVAGRNSTFSTASVPALARIGIRVALILFWTFPIYFLFVKWHSLYLLGPGLLIFLYGAVRFSSVPRLQAQTTTTG